MILKSDPHFTKKMKRYARKDSQLFIKAQKAIQQFIIDPQHPSLRLHKLAGNLGEYYSIAVDASARIIMEKRFGEWILLDIGTHDQIYRTN